MKKSIFAVIMIFVLTSPWCALSKYDVKTEADIKPGFMINPSCIKQMKTIMKTNIYILKTQTSFTV